MAVRIPVTLEISDEGLAALREAIGSAGLDDPPPPSADAGTEIELPERWEPLGETSGVHYTWGDHEDVYDPYLTFEGWTAKGKARMAIGKCERTRTHGRDRIYYIVLSIGPEGGMRAIAEFLATDDYDETREVIAIIKGKAGSGRQFDSASELPAIYRRWDTVTYRDRVDYPGSYLKQGLVCRENDFETMLNHSLVQILLRDL